MPVFNKPNADKKTQFLDDIFVYRALFPPIAGDYDFFRVRAIPFQQFRDAEQLVGFAIKRTFILQKPFSRLGKQHFALLANNSQSGIVISDR